MYKKLKFSTIIVLLLLLSACTTQPKVGLNKISSQQLFEKLEKNETFWILTLDAEQQLIEENGILDMYEQALQRAGITAFYVNVSELSASDRQKLGTNYLHPFGSSEFHQKKWDFEDRGLVYVENGGVLSMTNQVNFSRVMIEKDYIRQKEVDNNIHLMLEKLNFYNMKYELGGQ